METVKQIFLRLTRNKELQIVEKPISNAEQLISNDMIATRTAKTNEDTNRQTEVEIIEHEELNPSSEMRKVNIVRKNTKSDFVTQHLINVDVNSNTKKATCAINNSNKQDIIVIEDNDLNKTKIESEICKEQYNADTSLQNNDLKSGNIDIIDELDKISPTTDISVAPANLKDVPKIAKTELKPHNLLCIKNELSRRLNSSDKMGGDVNNSRIANDEIKSSNENNNIGTFSKTDENRSKEHKLDVDAENLMPSLEPQEWLNLDDFENIIKELNSTNSSEYFDIEEVLEAHTVEKKSINTNTMEEIYSNNEHNKNKSKLDSKGKTDDVISISSDDENDLLCISLDLDIPLSPIEVLDDEEIDYNSITPKDDWEMISIDKNVTSIEDIKSTEIDETKLSEKTFDNVNSHKILETKNKSEDASRVTNYAQNMNENNETLEISAEPQIKGNSIETDYLHENEMDTISLHSKSSCSDYHSSDIEFITEDEAKSDGLIITYYKKKEKAVDKETCKTVKVTSVTSDSGFNCSNNSQNSEPLCSFDVAGPSRQEEHVDNTERPNFEFGHNYRMRHDIPSGDRYLNLFNAYYAPATPYMYENKSMNSGIQVRQYEGIGFDMRLLQRQGRANHVNLERKKEADESAKIILNMYPGENRKRRRRL